MTVVVSLVVTLGMLRPFKAKHPSAQGHCNLLTLVGRNHHRKENLGGVRSRTASLAACLICIWFYKRNLTLVRLYIHGIDFHPKLSTRQPP